MKDAEKMTGNKLLKMPPSLLGRLTRVAGARNEDASEIMRRGLVTELDRLESLNQVETGRMEKLRALAAARGGDLDAILDQLVHEAVQPALPFTGTEG